MPNNAPYVEHFDLTVVAPILPERREALGRTLATVREQTLVLMRARGRGVDPGTGRKIPFDHVPGLHYARFVVIAGGSVTATTASLAFASDFDGVAAAGKNAETARRHHLQDWLRVARLSFDEVLSACVGYPGSAADDLAIVNWMEAHHIPAATSYIGCRGRGLQQIEEEAALRQRVETWVDAHRADLATLPPETIMQRLRAACPVPTSSPIPPRFFWAWLGFLLLGLLFLPLILLFVLAAVLFLLWREPRDPVFEPQYTPEERKHIDWASTDEDLFFQNQLTHIVDLKPGLMRALLIRAVYRLLRFLVVVKFNRGSLGGIPSIHFARWVLVNRGRTVLFFSNFDSSWESYLGDFVDKASSGLTAVWSNTVGYPRTRMLLWAGSNAATRFKAWARHHQLPTAVWYAALPGLSIVNVNDNSQLRHALSDPTVETSETTLRRLR